MNEALGGRRGTARIGGIFLAMAALTLAMAVSVAAEAALLIAIPAVLLGGTGIGLLVDARPARLVASLLLLACVVMLPLSLGNTLMQVSGPLEARRLLAAASAVATTVLLMWLCFRGLQVVRGKSLPASVFTARLTGGALAVIAGNHLWEAAVTGSWGLGAYESFAFRISTQGTALYGFPGWPLWHLAALAIAAILLVGRRPALGRAVTALAGLFACLVPLSLVAMVRMRMSMRELSLFIPVLALGLLPALLCWWLREELIGPLPAKLTAGALSSAEP